MLGRSLTALVVFALVSTAPPALAQTCGGWQSTFASPGPSSSILAWTEFDDGTGPALYAAGGFQSIGDQHIEGVARWNGTSWTPLGAGLPSVYCLAVYDDGAGPKLYAGRSSQFAPINTVLRWDGTTWSPLAGVGPEGHSNVAWTMQVFDDGSGPALYIGGGIDLPGSATRHGVVRWDGTTWSAVDSGLEPNTWVRTMAVFDDGTGARLYAAHGSSGTARGLRVWNGSSWSQTTPALATATITSLATYTDPAGTALYAAGRFETVAGTTYNNIARFDGTSWSVVGGGLTTQTSGLGPNVLSLAVHDDGSGARLVAGGQFEFAGGVPAGGLASWDGAVWRAFDLGGWPGYPVSLASFDDGTGPGLYVSGPFERAGRVPAANAAVWRAGEWHRLAAGEGVGSWVEALQSFDDGTGPALYAGGRFQTAGTTLAKSIARWDGAAWNALGAPADTDGDVLALSVFDNGAGPKLHAGGDFTRIGGTNAAGVASWDGASWSPLGLGVDGFVEALAAFDSGAGPELYAAGQFTQAGGVSASNIARWNGTSWSALGSGTNAWVRDLIVHDDGTGPALYASGDFTLAGSLNVPRIARWDGTTWSPVGSNLQIGNTAGFDLEVFDAGAGPELYMCGAASIAGVLTTIVRWDGTNWSAPGAVPAGVPYAMGTFHDGERPKLHVWFSSSEPQQSRIRIWDGSQWDVLPSTSFGQARCMHAHDAESDGVPDLYVGGAFGSVDDVPTSNIALWRSCGTVGTVACAGDGNVASCPCGNSGASGHGCANSAFAAGASLSNDGIASLAADSLELDADGMTGTTALFFQGTSQAGGGTGVPFDDGLLCASGTVVRLSTASMSGSTASVPQPGDPSLSVRGQILGPGTVRTYQVRYRNLASFCTPASSNFTNGLQIVWSL